MIGKIEKIWRYVLRHWSEQGRVEGQRVSCSLCHPSGSLKRTSSYQVDYSQVLGRMLHYVQHDNGGGVSPGDKFDHQAFKLFPCHVARRRLIYPGRQP